MGDLDSADKIGRRGFTLIELSIVLVIIGLIVGGVLVGQDMIRAAELRATIGQIEKYNTAVNTFRSKFGGIPGDLRSDLAAQFGFATRAGSRGRGDGNGIIDGSLNYGDYNQFYTQEAAMFWNDLSVATLIDGSFTGAQNQDTLVPYNVTTAQVPTTFPAAKMGRGNYITVGSLVNDPYPGKEGRGFNYWLITGIVSVSGTISAGYYTTTFNMTPIEAYNIDSKVDDGKPNIGRVQQPGTPGVADLVFDDSGNWQAAAGTGFCLMGGTTAVDTAASYNLSPATGGNTPACALSFRFN